MGGRSFACVGLSWWRVRPPSMDDQRVLSDPWREQVHGARVFGDRPKSGHPFRYVISDGMRRYVMPVVGPDTPRRVELCWTLRKGLVQGIGSWPVQLFIRLARMPYSSRSVTWRGDVLGPLRPGFGQTGLRETLLLASAVLSKALRAPLTLDGRTHVLAVWPVSWAHALLAEQEGAQGVLSALRVAGQSEAFDPGSLTSD